MKIAYIVDKPGSALHINAMSRLRYQSYEIICANDFVSPCSLLNYLLKENFELVFFAWRQGLYDIGQTCREYKLKYLASLKVGFLVADYLGLKLERRENILMSFSNFYYVTNKDLFYKYSKTHNKFKPSGIIHDVPDLELISKYRLPKTRNSDDPIKVIWVGNSKWGERKGSIDHKGFNRILMPFSRIITGHQNCMNLQIIDSSKKRLPNSEVLKQISESDFLIQTSLSEGTGMPLLEALGLGVVAISTNVGVAPELFQSKDLNFLVEPDAKLIHERIHELSLNENLNSVYALSIFDRYLKLISKEIIHPKEIYETDYSQTAGKYEKITVSLKWIFRYAASKGNFSSRIDH